MIPTIIVFKNKSLLNQYINKFIKQHQFKQENIFRIDPEKRQILVNQIRAIEKFIITEPKNKRLFIINQFDKATLEAQNAFLKTLEERTNNNQFLLIVNNKNHLLPTIKSRCRLINLDKEKTSFQLNKEIADLINQTIGSKNYRFLKVTLKYSTKDKGLQLIDQVIFYFWQKLKADQGKQAIIIIKECFRLKELIEKNNLNPQLALDNLLIFIHKTYTINKQNETDK